MSTKRRSTDQNRRYWALINRLPHLASKEENRRAVTLSVTAKVSTRDLSVSEMNGLCQYLEYLLGEKRLKDVEFPNEVSHAQATEIARLEKALEWHTNSKRLEGFLLRQTGGRTEKLDELTRTEAQKVINGLKFMAERNVENVAQAPSPVA